ncbi:hypothetical protein BKI52_26495 [marine bacterium AO1-C]|nr:hypothetical protein BKI52_26495 [marine bacterium AO1-C]
MKPTQILLVGILGLFFSTNNILAQKTLPTTNVGGKTFYKYTLVQGESLQDVAKKYKLSLADIYRDNPNARNGAKAGTVLFIPKDNKQVAAISKKTPTKKNTQTTAKKTSKARVYTSAQSSYTRHKVAKGENLFRISKKFNVPVKTIQKWNKLSGNRIIPGQELIVGVGKRRAAKRNTMRKRMAMRSKNTNAKNKTRRYRSQAPKEGKVPHTVKKGEWLATIAKKYKVSVTDLKKWNNLKSDKIKAGDTLWVHVGDVNQYKEDNPGGLTPPNNNLDPVNVNKKNPNDNPLDIKPKGDQKGKITHIVQKSETLYKISRKYKVTVREIKQWNKLTSSNYIKAGTELVIYPKGYQVKDNGGTGKNEGTSKNHIYQSAGNNKKKPTGADNPLDVVGSKDKYEVDGKKKVKYKVQSGDNLWKIAQTYKVKPEDIKTWNHLRNVDDLVVGQTLNIYTKYIPQTPTNSGGIPKPKVDTNNPVKQSNDVFDLIRPGGALYGNKPKTQTPPAVKKQPVKQPVKQPTKKVYKQPANKVKSSGAARKPVTNTYTPPQKKIYKQPASKVVKKKTFPNPPAYNNPVTSPIRNNNKPAAATTRPAMVIENPTRTTKTEVDKIMVFEKGMAGMIDVGQDSQKYQALHRTAPVGSFVRVTNLSNGKLVVVSVIGKLPESTPNNVIIKLTKRAYDQINAKDNIAVEIDYDLEKN